MGDYSLYTFCISTAWLGVGDIYLHIADSFEICHCYPFTEFTPYSYNVSIVWTRIVITTLSPLCLPISSRWHFLKFLKNHHLLLIHPTTSFSDVNCFFKRNWWLWLDLNQHAFLHGFLRTGCLPFHHIAINLVVQVGIAPTTSPL